MDEQVALIMEAIDKLLQKLSDEKDWGMMTDLGKIKDMVEKLNGK